MADVSLHAVISNPNLKETRNASFTTDSDFSSDSNLSNVVEVGSSRMVDSDSGAEDAYIRGRPLTPDDSISNKDVSSSSKSSSENVSTPSFDSLSTTLYNPNSVLTTIPEYKVLEPDETILTENRLRSNSLAADRSFCEPPKHSIISEHKHMKLRENISYDKNFSKGNLSADENFLIPPKQPFSGSSGKLSYRISPYQRSRNSTFCHDIHEHSPPEQYETARERKIPNVDSGYAWVILACSFFLVFTFAGNLFIFADYTTSISEMHGVSKSAANVIPAIANGVFMIGSAVSSFIITRYGCRPVTIVGSLLSTLGYIGAYLVPTYAVLIFMTIVISFGMNMMSLSGLLMLSQYFVKYNAIATAISLAGAGVGVFVLGGLYSYVIQSLGFSISLLVSAVPVFLLVIPGILFKPLPPDAFNIPTVYSEDQEYFDRTRSYCQPEVLNKSFSSLMLSPQAGYLSSSLYNITTPNRVGNYYSRNVLHPSDMSIDRKPGGPSTKCSFSFASPSKHSLGFSKSELSHELMSNPQSFVKRSNCDELSLISNCRLDDLLEEENTTSDGDSQPRIEAIESLRRKINLQIGDEESDDEDGEGSFEGKHTFDKESLFSRPFKIEWSPIWSSSEFWFFTISNFFWVFGTATFYIIWTGYGMEKGIPFATVMFAKQLSGIGDVFGRLSAGIQATKKFGNSVVAHAIIISTSALLLLSFKFNTSYNLFMVTSFFWGFSYGALNTYVPINSKMHFSEHFAAVIATNTVVPGISYFIGSPMAGLVADVTNSLEMVTTFLFLSCVVGSILMFVVYFLSRRTQSTVTSRDKFVQPQRKHHGLQTRIDFGSNNSSNVRINLHNLDGRSQASQQSLQKILSSKKNPKILISDDKV